MLSLRPAHVVLQRFEEGRDPHSAVQGHSSGMQGGKSAEGELEKHCWIRERNVTHLLKVQV